MADARAAAIGIAASALLGERWQRPLARLLDVDDRLVRRWAAGERPIPDWVVERVRAELRVQRGVIAAALRQLKGGA